MYGILKSDSPGLIMLIQALEWHRVSNLKCEKLNGFFIIHKCCKGSWSI